MIPDVPVVEATVDGLHVSARFHVGREATRRLIRFGEGYLQLTDAGTLVERDAQLGFVRDLLLPAAIGALAPDGGAALIATDDGRTWSLDVSGRYTHRGTFEGTPLWVGQVGRRDWILSELTDRALLFTPVDGGRPRRLRLRGLDLPDPVPHAFAEVDGRLWLGWDSGEWGGAMGWVDPAAGKLHLVGTDALAWVTGFAETDEGLLAYGGMSHFTESSSIWRVTSSDLEQVFAKNGASWLFGAGGEPTAPESPISQVLPEGDRFLVVAGADVWRADAAFRTWSRVTTLHAGRGGHAYAVGLGAAVADAAPDSDGWALASVADGLFRLTGDVVEHVEIDGQLPFAPDALLPAARGFAGSSWTLATAWDGAHWRPVPLADGVHPMYPTTQKWLDADGEPWRVAQRPGEEVIIFARWDGDGIVDRFDVRSPGIEAAGVLGRVNGRWMAVGRGQQRADDVFVLEDRVWRRAGPAPTLNAFAIARVPGASDLFVDDVTGTLLRAQPDAEPALALVTSSGGKKITDAAALDDGTVLLALGGGVAAFDPFDGRKVRRASPGEVRSVAVDACGRTWLAGEGLWMDDGVVHRVDDLDGLRGRRWVQVRAVGDRVVALATALVVEVSVPCRR